MNTRYRRNRGCVFTLQYHIVWCTKYRRKVLVSPIMDDLRSLIADKARELEVTVEALEIMPDHVHLFVSALPTDAVQHLVNQFKGFTSRILRLRYPSLRSRLPSLWSRSYYIGSVGAVSAETVQRYIAAQKGV